MLRGQLFLRRFLVTTQRAVLDTSNTRGKRAQRGTQVHDCFLAASVAFEVDPADLSIDEVPQEMQFLAMATRAMLDIDAACNLLNQNILLF